MGLFAQDPSRHKVRIHSAQMAMQLAVNGHRATTVRSQARQISLLKRSMHSKLSPSAAATDRRTVYRIFMAVVKRIN